MVVTLESPNEIVTYISGLSHGIRPGYGYYLEAMEEISHAKEAKDILIVGFGTGSFIEAALKVENINSVTVIELSQAVLNNAKKVDETNRIFEDEKLTIIIDDVRRYLQRTDRKFDVVLMDPLRVTTAYSNNLYSRDFFLLVNNHLKQGGIFGAWNNNEHRVLPNTMLHSFENVRIYSYFMIASDDNLNKNEERYAQLLKAFEREFNTEAIVRFEKDVYFIGDQSTLREELKDERVNSDYRPWLEYGLGEKVRRALSKI